MVLERQTVTWAYQPCSYVNRRATSQDTLALFIKELATARGLARDCNPLYPAKEYVINDRLVAASSGRL